MIAYIYVYHITIYSIFQLFYTKYNKNSIIHNFNIFILRIIEKNA